jgi:hypothetical protein
MKPYLPNIDNSQFILIIDFSGFNISDAAMIPENKIAVNICYAGTSGLLLPVHKNG